MFECVDCGLRFTTTDAGVAHWDARHVEVDG